MHTREPECIHGPAHAAPRHREAPGSPAKPIGVSRWKTRTGWKGSPPCSGLLRQYFPKGTDPSVHPEDHLDAVAEELNDRPRKTLGFMKPSEKIIELLDAA